MNYPGHSCDVLWKREGVIQGKVTDFLRSAILFPPSAFVYFILVTAGFEQGGARLSLTRVASGGSDNHWHLSRATILAFLACQILLYPMVGVLLDHLLHGIPSKGRRVRPNHLDNGDAVRLAGFCKTFKSRRNKKQLVQAVDDLTLSLRAGSITTLLGSNGSGKSTTLNAIAGLESITHGTIEIDGSSGLGLCPQKNVLWNELTVFEHISCFAELKRLTALSRREHKQEVLRIIEGCDLTIKASARAGTLSGGQKRKLQLACMLAGDSKV